MDDNTPALISGEVETIEIKPDSIELLLDSEDPVWSKEESLDDSQMQSTNNNECCYVASSGEVIAVSPEDMVQTPFCLESYFMDGNKLATRVAGAASSQERQIIEIDRVTCYQCDIEFCNEHRLLEHLMKHIDVYKMGCNICDKDLNFEEKFQLHSMAVTWQSVYYCDFCRKSCAGVVRSKSHPPPPGKIYMCHDCEYQTQQENTKFQCVRFYLSTSNNGCDSSKPPPNILPKPIMAPLPSKSLINSIPVTAPASLPLSPPTPVLTTVPTPMPTPVPLQKPPAEDLQLKKEVDKAELEICRLCPVSGPTSEISDCCTTRDTLLIKKENENCRPQKPKVKIMKVSTRSYTSEQNKKCKYKCRYCPATLDDEFALSKHLTDEHRFHKLRYVCKLCGKDFMQQRCYENHLNFHQLAKNHVCLICNLAFLSKQELERHARLHEKTKFIDACRNDGIALDLRKKKNKS